MSDAFDGSTADVLASWFEATAREFPWRRRRDAYATWVAETMLQQTRADVVVPYFERWMESFPTVQSLASASEREVLAAWEGLGYYGRARRLREAAAIVVDRHGGRLPGDERALLTLPGIGPYAAAAIAAFAFGARTVAVDGNVRRVGSRLIGEPRPSDASLRRRLRPLLPVDHPGVGTEALIELGATVCTPTRPRCGACPLASVCVAARDGRQDELPARLPRKRPALRSSFAWVVVGDEGTWMIRRHRGGLLGGLWGVPQRSEPRPGTTLGPVRHVYSHLDLTVVPIVSSDDTPPPLDASEAEGAWVRVDDLDRLPCSRVDRKILDLARRSGLLR